MDLKIPTKAPGCQPDFIIIKVVPTGRGLFDAFDGSGHLIAESTRTPFFASARVFAAKGFDPKTRIVMIAPSGTPSLASTVGHAAGLAISESESHGPRVVKFRPMAGLKIPPREEDASFDPKVAEEVA